MQIYFGRMARTLHWCTEKVMTAELEKMELTAAQGHVMGYLTHADHTLCPRDVENEFHLSHPTISGILSRLEQKEFLELRPDPEDRRVKRIYILPKGIECRDRMNRVIADNEAQMVAGFTPEERKQFAAFLNRAIQNMKGEPRQTNDKEET